MIRIVGRAYLDWNYPFVHRRFPSPRRELPRELVPVPTSDLRAEQQLSGRADLIRNKLPIFMPIVMCTCMRYPRDERAATVQQLTGRTGSDRVVNLQRQHRNRTETARQTRRNCAAPAQYNRVHICMYLGQTYRHKHAHIH